MTRADMAKSVDHAEISENAAAGYDILKQRGLDDGNWVWRRLGMRWCQSRQGDKYRSHTKTCEPIAHGHCRLLQPSGIRRWLANYRKRRQPKALVQWLA